MTVVIVRAVALLVVMVINLFLIVFNLDKYNEVEEDEEHDATLAWRGINLAVGDGFQHHETCDELADLRAAGWTIEKVGNERYGFVQLTLTGPQAPQPAKETE